MTKSLKRSNMQENRLKTLEQFFNDLGSRESAGNYAAVNKYGYLGKYQMGEQALIDTGYYLKPSKKYNNDWSGKFTGKDAVFSKQDFLKNHLAQENAQFLFMKKQWSYLKSVKAHNYLGKIINGFKITSSGLLAAAHLKGAGAVILYLKNNGNIIQKDAFGTTVESYMMKFANYDVSKITGYKEVL